MQKLLFWNHDVQYMAYLDIGSMYSPVLAKVYKWFTLQI